MSALQHILTHKIVAIVRLDDYVRAVEVGRALVNGGISVLEFTLTGKGAIEAIAMVRQTLGGAVCVGVGSVLKPEDAHAAVDSGAQFVENYQRLLDLIPSPMNGITLCQGNFTLMTDDLPGVIRHFGRQNKIFFIHFRDVLGKPERFIETWHDDGQTDMLACMQAYRDIGFEGVLRPDHVPTVEGDSNANAGYSSFGRLYAIGYIRGLRQAVYAG